MWARIISECKSLWCEYVSHMRKIGNIASFSAIMLFLWLFAFAITLLTFWLQQRAIYSILLFLVALVFGASHHGISEAISYIFAIGINKPIVDVVVARATVATKVIFNIFFRKPK